MHKPVAALATAALVSVLVASGVGAQEPPDDDDATVLALGSQVAPKSTAPAGKRPTGPNPFLALLPDVSTVDYSGWKTYVDAKSQQRADQRALARVAPPTAVSTPIVVDEEELPESPGSNDTPSTAQPVDGFGTRRNQNPAARILGDLSAAPIAIETIEPNPEDDGAIPLAGATGIGTELQGITTSATIGDGPHGSAAGDP